MTLLGAASLESLREAGGISTARSLQAEASPGGTASDPDPGPIDGQSFRMTFWRQKGTGPYEEDDWTGRGNSGSAKLVRVAAHAGRSAVTTATLTPG